MDNPQAKIIPALFVGDLVVITEEHQRPGDQGLVFEITRINPVNWSLAPINGDRPLRCPPELLRKATAEEIAAAQAAPRLSRPFTAARWSRCRDPVGGSRPSSCGAYCDSRASTTSNSDAWAGPTRIYPKVPRKYLTPLTDDQVAAMTVAAKAA